jgi:hypothetical protein
MKYSRVEKQLDTFIDHIKLTAAQTEVLESIHHSLLNHLSNEKGLAVCCVDTVLYELHDEPRFHYAWATGALEHWLGRNQNLILELSKSVLHRFIILPTYSSIRDPFLRSNFLNVVIFNLHIHLWHGVVACVIFLDPRKHNPKELSKRLNITSVPLHKTIFGSADFYGSNNLDVFQEQGPVARDHFNQLYSVIKESEYTPIWLWYDESNYSQRRLTGAKWETLRSFFYHFEIYPFVCPICKQKGPFTLDHVLPIADGHYQTLLNFMGICKKCNSFKRDRYPRFDPYGFPQFIPEKYRSEALRKILTEPPPWLGTVSRPSDKRSLNTIIHQLH